MGLHNLLISLHLAAHAQSRLSTQREYIIPIDFDTGSFALFNQSESEAEESESPSMRAFVPSIENSVSVRPVINIEDWRSALNNTILE